jgi:hypothetical protein
MIVLLKTVTMKRMLFPILLLFLIGACEKDELAPYEPDETYTPIVDLRSDNAALAEEVAQLMEEVEALVIPFGPKKSILVQLRNIERKLQRGQTQVALDMLASLIVHIEELIADGTVTEENIPDLLDDLEWIRCEADPECENVDMLEVWIDDPDGGYTLYVHPNDQRTGDDYDPFTNDNGVQWGGYGYDVPGVENITSFSAALTDFDGYTYTPAIVEYFENNPEIEDTDYAAKVCVELEYNGHQDWYLPSIGELKAIYEHLFVEKGGIWFPETERNLVNNFNGSYYWSSSEVNSHGAWIQLFTYGDRAGYNKTQVSGSCRCVRR